jgi:Uma2 family endonuclease
MTVSVFKWTLDLYHQAIAAGIFADQEQKLELLRGEIVVIPPEREPHAFFSDRFADRLPNHLVGRAKIREGKPVILPNDSQPEPDIAIVQALEEVYRNGGLGNP